MASPKAINPAKTTLFYRGNKKSRLKHNRDNNTGGKHDATKEYTRKHTEVRRRLKPRKREDIIRKGRGGTTWTTQSMKINRGRK